MKTNKLIAFDEQQGIHIIQNCILKNISEFNEMANKARGQVYANTTNKERTKFVNMFEFSREENFPLKATDYSESCFSGS